MARHSPNEMRIYLREMSKRYTICRPFKGDGPLAQLAEQLTLNQRVAGSNPSRSTILMDSMNACLKRAFLLLWGLKYIIFGKRQCFTGPKNPNHRTPEFFVSVFKSAFFRIRTGTAMISAQKEGGDIMAAVAAEKQEAKIAGRNLWEAPRSYERQPPTNEYVLKDTFDAQMRRIDERFISFEKLMDERFSKMQTVMEKNFALMNERIEKNLAQYEAIANDIRGDVKALTARFDTLQSRFAWNLAWVGIIMGLVLAIVQRFWR